MKSGLPSASVSAVTQDREGRIWFATAYGIACYDGVSYRVYNTRDGLHTLNYIMLSTGPEGDIWALPRYSTKTLRLSRFDIKKNRWTTSPPQPFISHENLRVSGLQVIRPEKKSSVPVIAAVSTHDRGLYLLCHGKWTVITESHGLISDRIKGVSQLSGKLYAATEKGLSVLSFKPLRRCRNMCRAGNRQPAFRSTRFPYPRGYVPLPVEDRRRYPADNMQVSRIWFLGRDWLGYAEENKNELTHFPVSIPSLVDWGHISMVPDYLNGIYIGGVIGVRYFNETTGSLETLNERNGLAGRRLSSLYIDFEKNIWMPGGRGVSKVASRSFANYYRQDGMLENEVTAILGLPARSICVRSFRGHQLLGWQPVRKPSVSESNWEWTRCYAGCWI